MKLSFVLDLKLIRFALSRWRVVDGESLYILDTTADFLVPPFASHRHSRADDGLAKSLHLEDVSNE
jgi:hypothetical protein